MAEMVTLVQARMRVQQEAAARGMSLESVELGDSLGRRLGQDYRATEPWPTTDRSAMDGFAVAAGDAGVPAGQEFGVVGESLAGNPFEGEVPPGCAIRIMTGAVVPGTVDAVIPVERSSGYEGQTVTFTGAVARGDNIRLRGSEVTEGDLLLARGSKIRSAEVGALAVLGVHQVPVYRRPVVAILSTGDEVVPVDQTPAPHQVRDSNSHALAAQVRESGARPLRLGCGRDERDDLMRLLQRGLDEADVLLTIGGVSKGTHDLVHGCLRELGVDEVFHGVVLKPGKPAYFGVQRSRGKFVFGLPGNPASAYTVFDLLVRPLLTHLTGGDATERSVTVRPGGAPFRKNWRLQAVPARLGIDPEGRAVAELTAVRPSGDPFSLVAADGLVLIPADAPPEAVSEVPFEPYGDGWPTR